VVVRSAVTGPDSSLLRMKIVLWLVIIGFAVVHSMHLNDLIDHGRMDLEESQEKIHQFIDKRDTDGAG